MKEVCGFQDEQGRFFATKEELLKEQDRERKNKVLMDAAITLIGESSAYEYMPYYVVEKIMEYCVKNPDKYTQLLADYSGKQIRYTVMDNAQNFDIMSVVDPKTSTTTPPQVTKQQKKWYQF